MTVALTSFGLTLGTITVVLYAIVLREARLARKDEFKHRGHR